MFRRTAHPGVGTFLTATAPLQFGGVSPLPPGLAPQLGQDTRAVLQRLLGLDDATLQDLAAAGTLGQA
jgi:crotonobetainyl-CoA:carnitine CoA-transferase CaiB-like acyl-CoA transferase